MLVPDQARRLIDAGFHLTVESSTQSAFPAADYRDQGCEIVSEHAWKSDAPPDAIVLGLKELETESTPLVHRHIHFAHVYKNQAGWEELLQRFVDGGGSLYDLEFLIDADGHRVAAFGHWAGFSGAALALLAWAGSTLGENPVLLPVQSVPGRQVLVERVIAAIDRCGRVPRVLVIGALGRCGRGAVEMCRDAGAEVVAWDIAETSRGGPFDEILESDVFLNCVFVDKPIPPFLTRELIERHNRRLTVICDVSCDPYGNCNPVPVYDRCTTFARPVDRIVGGDTPLYLIAIDHLPSLLPRESSRDFCEQLMPHLLQLDNLDNGVWGRAHQIFLTKTAQLRGS